MPENANKMLESLTGPLAFIRSGVFLVIVHSLCMRVISVDMIFLALLGVPVVLQVPEPLNSCTFAARLPASEVGLPLPLSAFKGQMGCIYLFEDLLSSGSPAGQQLS